MQNPTAILPFLPAFPLFFIAIWFLVCAAISYVGGWASLARPYCIQSDFVGNRWKMQTGQMRWGVSYRNCLTVGGNEVGLYLAVLPLFRFKHPPLLIPWEEISVTRQKGPLFEHVVFRLGREEGIRLRVQAKLADNLRAAAGGRCPVESIG